MDDQRRNGGGVLPITTQVTTTLPPLPEL